MADILLNAPCCASSIEPGALGSPPQLKGSLVAAPTCPINPSARPLLPAPIRICASRACCWSGVRLTLLSHFVTGKPVDGSTPALASHVCWPHGVLIVGRFAHVAPV